MIMFPGIPFRNLGAICTILFSVGPATAFLPSSIPSYSWGGRRSAQLKLSSIDLVPSVTLPFWTLLSADAGPDSATIGTALAVGAAGAVATGALFKVGVYWRMQYIVAALLSNRIPKVPGGAEVLELSSKDSKTLYYMPNGGVKRVILSAVKDLDEKLVNTAAVQAGVPLALIRKQVDGTLGCPTGTMDTVVSVYGFSEGGTGGETKKLIQEVARVLKPGGTLLFVEKGEPGKLVDDVRDALGKVDINVVKNLVEPYCVALGVKTKQAEDGEGEGENKDNQLEPRSSGFKSSKKNRKSKKGST
ncbi:unnamed protein product [Choristocarpus tenellus]